MRPERIYADPGAAAAKYSAQTRSGSMTWFNHKNRRCAGPCGRARSLTQFAAGDDLCLQCRRRA